MLLQLYCSYSVGADVRSLQADLQCNVMLNRLVLHSSSSSSIIPFYVVSLHTAGVNMVMPGDDTPLTITMNVEIPVEVGQRFTLREGGKTVGTGVITEMIE